jgi:non-ribosomal peptide synthase protein (TIGR01720 family)
LLGDLSLARTVGYITSNIPVLITLPPNPTAANVIELVNKHLRQMPNSGIGYGILRYLLPRHTELATLRDFPPAEVKFNFLGSLATSASATKRFRPVPIELPGVLDADDCRAYLHNIEIVIAGNKLQVEWKYSADAHRAQTIQSLLEQYIATLRGLIHAATPTSSVAASRPEAFVRRNR